MEILKVVPTLEKLARDEAYKAILNCLSLCYGHGPTGNRFYLRCRKSEKIRRRVRRRFDKILKGIMSDQARYIYNYKFISSLHLA